MRISSLISVANLSLFSVTKEKLSPMMAMSMLSTVIWVKEVPIMKKVIARLA